VAVDWQEPLVLRPSIARVNVQLDPRYAASKHTTAPINHTSSDMILWAVFSAGNHASKMKS